MRAVTVYRLDASGNFSYHTRHAIGSVLERRKQERVNNYKELLRLARNLFALDAADAIHVILVWAPRIRWADSFTFSWSLKGG